MKKRIHLKPLLFINKLNEGKAISIRTKEKRLISSTLVKTVPEKIVDNEEVKCYIQRQVLQRLYKDLLGPAYALESRSTVWTLRRCFSVLQCCEGNLGPDANKEHFKMLQQVHTQQKGTNHWGVYCDSELDWDRITRNRSTNTVYLALSYLVAVPFHLRCDTNSPIWEYLLAAHLAIRGLSYAHQDSNG